MNILIYIFFSFLLCTLRVQILQWQSLIYHEIWPKQTNKRYIFIYIQVSFHIPGLLNGSFFFCWKVSPRRSQFFSLARSRWCDELKELCTFLATISLLQAHLSLLAVCQTKARRTSLTELTLLLAHRFNPQLLFQTFFWWTLCFCMLSCLIWSQHHFRNIHLNDKMFLVVAIVKSHISQIWI